MMVLFISTQTILRSYWRITPCSESVVGAALRHGERWAMWWFVPSDALANPGFGEAQELAMRSNGRRFIQAAHLTSPTQTPLPGRSW